MDDGLGTDGSEAASFAGESQLMSTEYSPSSRRLLAGSGIWMYSGGRIGGGSMNV